MITLSGLTAVNAFTIPQQPSLRWPQDVVMRAFTKLYPQHWLADLPLPFIEDLLQTRTFTAYAEWREEHHLPIDKAWGPAELKGRMIAIGRYATGRGNLATSGKPGPGRTATVTERDLRHTFESEPRALRR